MPRLLDLFCGAGGCSAGYVRAGFEVVGVDVASQPHYPYEFIQADAMTFPLDGFDVVHASPPCHAWSGLNHLHRRWYPQLIERTRERLWAWGGTYVIENVPGAPLIAPLTLCGTMFTDVRVIRHRLFESSVQLGPAPMHGEHPRCFTWDRRSPHYGEGDQWSMYVTVTGGGHSLLDVDRDAMGIDWMTRRELSQAIPPAYTEYIGAQLIAQG